MGRPTKRKRARVDWGDEVAGAVGIVGRFFGKLLTGLLNVLLTIMLICLITGLVVGSVFLYYVKNYIDTDLSAFEGISTSSSMTTKLYYMDWSDRTNRIGDPIELEDQRLYGSTNRIWVSIQNIPKNLQNAFIAIEDKRFYDHKGVDFIPTIRATVNYFLGGEKVFGASTITQQLIKNVTGDDDVTVQRKIQEIMRAFQLEKDKDKSEILEMYLNLIYLSQGCYGVQAAAYTYFGKDVSELSLIECCAIAAITQSPTKWDPVQNPENNAYRRDVILTAMRDQNLISESEFQSAYGQELTLDYHENTASNSTNSWYTDAAIEEAIKLLMQEKGYTYKVAETALYTKGYQIYLAMDPFVQDTLDTYFAEAANFPAVDKSPIQPECSMCIIDPKTGDVLGVAGGRGEKSGNRIQNYATDTRRSPGSSIKPLSVYAPAMDAGLITYGSVIDDSPVNFGEPIYTNGQITGYTDPDGYPDNYSKTYRGLTTINYAISNSLNTVALKVLQTLTPAKSFDFVRNKLHMTSFIESKELTGGTIITDRNYSALSMGGMNYGVTVLEMTAAYQIFPNNGVYNTPRFVWKICDSEGNTVVSNDTESSIVISEQTACIMTKLLQNVVTSGTARAAISVRMLVNTAGKTGTTSDDYDRWFMGYTPYYVGGVWFGYEYQRSLSSFSASISPAAKVWDDIMNKLHEKAIADDAQAGKSVRTFEMADGVITASYCADSGEIPTEVCSKYDPRGSRVETGYFTRETAPSTQCSRHVLVNYDKSTGAVACEDCPADSLKKVGLVKYNRSMESFVYIGDAQYLYRELPAGVEPSLEANEPFYLNAVPRGTYVGLSYGESQYNHYCAAHYKSAQQRAEEEESRRREEESSASESTGEE